MREESRIYQVLKYMRDYRLDILGISETRWKDFGEEQIEDHTLLYSGQASKHEHGVGILLSKKASGSLLEWKPVSERIITARFRSRVRNVTIVQCYAPTNAADLDVKERTQGGNVEEEWKAVKDTFLACCGDLLGHRNKDCKDHISADTWDKILYRKTIKDKLNCAKDQSTKETLAYQYFICESDVKRSARRDQRVRAAEIAGRAEHAANTGNTRELYRAGKELCNKPPSHRPIADKSGKLLTTQEDQMRRWHEHFAEVFHTVVDGNDDTETEVEETSTLNISVASK
ncbi:uncharacterized protein [Choristoneura fumiferana]|uniref:uncharacterized protein n=1 Tax=Choristoneura fumiferana TaxID=7141 RepID=UPI003D15B0E5